VFHTRGESDESIYENINQLVFKIINFSAASNFSEDKLFFMEIMIFSLFQCKKYAANLNEIKTISLK